MDPVARCAQRRVAEPLPGRGRSGEMLLRNDDTRVILAGLDGFPT